MLSCYSSVLRALYNGARHTASHTDARAPFQPGVLSAASLALHGRGLHIDTGPMEIFDRELKRAHRDRAAFLMKDDDPLLHTVADRLLDRLEDCKRSFPEAIVLGGAGHHVLDKIKNGRAGIERALYIDMSPDMVERARAKAGQQQPGEADTVPSVSYLVGDEEFLPVEPASADLIISCLGFHWVNDLPGALVQCARALRPDGLLLSAMFGGETLQELRIACSRAHEDLEGGVAAVVSPLAQVRDAGNLLTRARLALPTVDVDTMTMHYASPFELVDHLRSMGESNALKTRRHRLPRATALQAAQNYRDMFSEEDGTVSATYTVIYMTGWAPAPHQPKPKERGSATVSFADMATALQERGAVAGAVGEGQEGEAAGTTADDGGGGVEGEAPLTAAQQQESNEAVQSSERSAGGTDGPDGPRG